MKELGDLEFVPEADRAKLANLLTFHGSEWMTDLLNAEDPKTDGTSKGVSLAFLLKPDEPHEEPFFPTGAGLEVFLTDVDWEYEAHTEKLREGDEFALEWDPILDAISLWISHRIMYLRTFQGKNAKEARVQAYEEIQGVDLGGEELLCATCASFFWDNQRRLKGAERDFCSIKCQEKVEKYCITCGTHYVVGRARRGWRNTDRLSGFCTPECAAEHYEKEAKDRAYLHGVKKRFEQYNSPAEFDESVTRRAVFDRDGGKCYICGKATNWVRQGDWDPSLANLDHKIPVSKGGSHTWENVALSCQLCNTRKGARNL